VVWWFRLTEHLSEVSQEEKSIGCHGAALKLTEWKRAPEKAFLSDDRRNRRIISLRPIFCSKGLVEIVANTKPRDIHEIILHLLSINFGFNYRQVAGRHGI
jgi:hypothetical protein